MDAEKFRSCLLGLMVGDAIGLPREGISRRRASKLFGDTVRHSFVGPWGMVSDDTEHACFVARSLIRYGRVKDDAGFARSLAWQLRLWLVSLPAGVGSATLRATLKLWIGFPARCSGVWSAGNGPAMRSPLLGVYFADDPHSMRRFVSASTYMTHTDPKAEYGAQAIALAAAYAVTHSNKCQFSSDELLDQLQAIFPQKDLEAASWLAFVRQGVDARWTAEEFCLRAGFPDGPSGYIYHTVPAVLFAWLRYPFDFRESVSQAIGMGGDADTTGAICGALCGITAGTQNIPIGWLKGVRDFPRSREWIRRLAFACYQSRTSEVGQPGLFWPFIIPRNLFFLLVVLIHGFRRLFPPY